MKQINKEPKVRRCKYCGAELVVIGFSRKLITQGKNKGLSIVKDFLGCRNNECNKNKNVIL